ncbi:hypothetical protein ACX9NE_22810 [Mycobacterium sp. ML4]
MIPTESVAADQVDTAQPCGELTAESGDASRQLLDTAAKAYRRYHEEMKVDFKGLNFYVCPWP